MKTLKKWVIWGFRGLDKRLPYRPYHPDPLEIGVVLKRDRSSRYVGLSDLGKTYRSDRDNPDPSKPLGNVGSYSIL